MSAVEGFRAPAGGRFKRVFCDFSQWPISLCVHVFGSLRPETCPLKGMPLLNLILLFIVVGVVLYLINTYIPMAPPVKTVMNVVVVRVFQNFAQPTE